MKTILAHKLLIILIIAIVARLGVLLRFPDVFAFEQTGAIHGSEAYDSYARNLLATGVYGRTAGVPDAMIPPLYSYALALVYGLFGRGYLQVGLFHIALDALSITTLYFIGKKLMTQHTTVGARHASPLQPDKSDWIPALAALFYALYPYLIFQNLTLIDTPFFMTLLYAFLLIVVLLRDRPALDRGTWGLVVLGGLALGAGMLTRPIIALLALLSAVWFLFRLDLRQTILRLLPVAVIGALVTLPWMIRNQQVYGQFIALSLNSGENFYQGNSAYTIPFFRAGYDVQWTPPLEYHTTDNPNSPEGNDERFSWGIAYLRDHPGKIPELLWVKFLVYWSIDIAPRYNPQPNERLGLDAGGSFIIQRVDDSGQLLTYGANDPVNAYAEPLFDVIGRTVHRFYWGGLFLLGLLGGVLALRYWRDTLLLWFAQISMTAAYLIFHPSTRYRVPTDPLWFLFSAYGLVWLWAWWRKRRARLHLASAREAVTFDPQSHEDDAPVRVPRT